MFNLPDNFGNRDCDSTAVKSVNFYTATTQSLYGFKTLYTENLHICSKVMQKGHCTSIPQSLIG